MPFSFPSSPSIGDKSTQNSREYEWSGYAWEIVATPAALSASVITSGTFDAARLPLATTIAAGAVIVGTGLGVSSGTVSVTYGTNSTSACRGDDSRLSDTRTPTDGSVTTTKLANDAVTYAKLQNVSATDRLLGRSSAGAGDVEEITCTAFGRSLIDDADAATARTTLSVQPTASPAFTGAATVTNDGNVVPLTVTNTGTANSFVVNDASGDTSPFVIDASGNIGIGTSSPGAALDVGSGNLRFSSTAQRITGDFSNATISNRLMFQSSTSNGNTSVRAIANGTATTSNFAAHNGSDANNTSFIAIQANPTETIVNSGSVGTGTNLPLTFYTGGAAQVQISTGGQLLVTAGSASACGVAFSGDVNTGLAQIGGADTASLVTAGVERVRVGSNGRVAFHANSEKYGVQLNNGSTGNGPFIGSDGADIFTISTSGGAERLRVDASGNVCVNSTGDTNPAGSNVAGACLSPGGYLSITRDSDNPLLLNRKTNDGTLTSYQQDAVTEGSVSVSNNTVSYNAFCGSHWAQLIDNSRPSILRGTVLETIDEMCEWPGEPQNDRLPRVKVSDTPGSRRVYGVFMAWDDEYASTGDLYATALGAYMVRVSGVVQSGDLLESAGDGTARTQPDDIVRSSTIGKVSSTHRVAEYDDGSYLVPCVLMCG